MGAMLASDYFNRIIVQQDNCHHAARVLYSSLCCPSDAPYPGILGLRFAVDAVVEKRLFFLRLQGG